MRPRTLTHCQSLAVAAARSIIGTDRSSLLNRIMTLTHWQPDRSSLLMTWTQTHWQPDQPSLLNRLRVRVMTCDTDSLASRSIITTVTESTHDTAGDCRPSAHRYNCKVYLKKKKCFISREIHGCRSVTEIDGEEMDNR
jgi:hypothetical protein